MADAGIQTVEEAFAAAKAELNGTAAPTVTVDVGAVPATAPTEVPPVGDHPGTNPETQALVDSLVEQPTEPPPAPIEQGEEFWKQSVDIDGELIPLGELKNRGLRHSDYTRKTQALAEQRKELEAANNFYQQFLNDPTEFARSIAVEHGWIDVDATGPITKIDVPKPPTEEEFNARLDELVEERLQSDDRYKAAEILAAEKAIADEFTRLEQSVGVSIPQELRQSLLDEAQERQVFDLELLLQARMAAQMEKQRTNSNLARSGTSRPNSGGGAGSDPNEGQNPIPMTVEEAWAQAKAEAANR